MYSKTARDIVWQWTQDHWPEIKSFFPDILGVGDLWPRAATNYLSTKQHLEELQKFMREQDVSGAELQLRHSMERLRGVIGWVERDSEDIKHWLGLDRNDEL